MLRLLVSKAHGCKDLWKPSKPCHFGTHWIALTEYSHMSTHMPGFQSFFRFFASFCIGQTSHQGLSMPAPISKCRNSLSMPTHILKYWNFLCIPTSLLTYCNFQSMPKPPLLMLNMQGSYGHNPLGYSSLPLTPYSFLDFNSINLLHSTQT